MGLYATAQELFDRYPNCKQDNTSAEVESNFINYAEAELSGRLSSYFTVPFSNNNLTVKELTLDLAYIRMMKGIKPEIIDKKREMIDTIIQELKDGDRSMITTENGAITATSEVVQTVGGTVYNNMGTYTPIFGFDDVEDFEIDPDLIDSEESSRL